MALNELIPAFQYTTESPIPPSTPMLERRMKRASKQYGRFAARTAEAWALLDKAIDNLAPRETVSAFRERAEAMEELTRSAWRKLDTSKLALLGRVS
jgi:hypothetical protein